MDEQSIFFDMKSTPGDDDMKICKIFFIIILLFHWGGTLLHL
jgi:hypothetical protein